MEKYTPTTEASKYDQARISFNKGEISLDDLYSLYKGISKIDLR